MTPSIRILDTGQNAARWNVAMTAAITASHAAGAVPCTIRFHRYPDCVLLGRNQEARRVADIEGCRRHGYEIARRISGGGAVFMTPRMLAWDVVVDRKSWGGDLAVMTSRICSSIANGLGSLGVAAKFRAPNDIEIGGRKVAGTSGYAEGRSAVLQGTVMMTDDTVAMAAALRLPAEMLKSRLTCLAEVCRTLPSLAAVTECILSGLLDRQPLQPVRDQPSPGELTQCETLLHNEIGTDAFVFGPAG